MLHEVGFAMREIKCFCFAVICRGKCVSPGACYGV